MKTVENIRDFLNDFVSWAAIQPDVQAIALVGSYARGAAREDSDIDLVLLTDQSQKYFEDLKWIERFGAVDRQQVEDYGKLISVRVWYQNGVEVEYGITMASSPSSGKNYSPTSCTELLILTGHASRISSVAFSPDRTRLVSASADGMARVYLLRLEELITLAKSRGTR